MDTLLGIASGICLLVGAILLISGAVGLLRFPDFYTRMHAAGVTDTLAAMSIILGLMLLSYSFINFFKLGLILLFLLFTAPTASHALAKAARHSEK